MASVLSKKNLLGDRLQAELAKRHINFDELSERLRSIGVEATADSVKEVLAHDDASALFITQCFIALAAEQPAPKS